MAFVEGGETRYIRSSTMTSLTGVEEWTAKVRRFKRKYVDPQYFRSATVSL